MIHVLFTGGGTLGPVTPLLAVAESVHDREPDARFSWIGTRTGPERTLVEGAGIPFIAIPSGKFRRYASWRNITDVFAVKLGFLRSLVLLMRLRPDVVVSAGGYVAVPVCAAAWCLRIPVHVHAQDVRPGLANKLSLPFVSSMSVAFESSLRDFAGARPAWTGNPVRRAMLHGSRATAAELFGLEPNVPTLLALGGGTGAAGLNALVRAAVPRITEGNLQVLHVTGRGKGIAAFSHLRYHAVEFLAEDLAHAYAAADIVVTRAGLGTLSELAARSLPSIIVPMPRSHQEDNASYFADHHAASVLDELSATQDSFADAVLALFHDADRRAGYVENMRNLARHDAAGAVADLVLAAPRKRTA